MQYDIEKRLKENGIVLPEAPRPAANYVPFVRTGNLLFLAGSLPFVNNKLETTGLLGHEVDVERGKALAEICAINMLAQVKAATGDLNLLSRVVRLSAFVACVPGFYDQPAVVNGASDFLVKILGEKGKHARSAIGVSALPLNSPLEIEGVFEINQA
ncbi:RidA family protein [Paraburkholderia silviterrae]|uniref:RidA family protein n=1 Tax=Paraburkholderia silviterrae TaxID=2528715 RepID=A0A4R5LXS1_9BURK|nr:RidA family protein [Paraburkholderia silviterrae]TDG16799.1 RidA family protein [Paraburkholderia silviterrae]